MRVGDSGGVDNDCRVTGIVCLFETSVNESSVQRLRSSWLCGVLSWANVELVEFDPDCGPPERTVRL